MISKEQQFFGLAWLISSPKVEAVAIDEHGEPVRLVVIDPRAFAAHKVLRDRLKQTLSSQLNIFGSHFTAKNLTRFPWH